MQPDELIADLVKEVPHRRYFKGLDQTKAGKKMLSTSREDQRALAMSMIEWLDEPELQDHARSIIWDTLPRFLRRKLPYNEKDVMIILDWGSRQWGYPGDILSFITTVLKNYLAANPLTPEIQQAIQGHIDSIRWNTMPSCVKRSTP